jgi:hypothetical protein
VLKVLKVLKVRPALYTDACVVSIRADGCGETEDSSDLQDPW